MEQGVRRHHAEVSFAIENYHRELKQFCGVEKCQVRSEQAQRNHREHSRRLGDLGGFVSPTLADNHRFPIYLDKGNDHGEPHLGEGHPDAPQASAQSTRGDPGRDPGGPTADRASPPRPTRNQQC